MGGWGVFEVTVQIDQDLDTLAFVGGIREVPGRQKLAFSGFCSPKQSPSV